MPTTSYVDFNHSVFGIASRTDSAGVAVNDFSAEEARMHLPGYSEGAVDDAAFLVAVSSGMGLTVGSGSAKTDRYIVSGDVAGQQSYTVRLDSAPVAVTVPAAEASATRTDEVYLVVLDAAYDAGALSLPRLGYRKGNAGGAAPGMDASWKAAALLATVTVPAAATSVTAGNVADARAFAYAPSPVPAGTIQPFAGPTAPAGWLLCNGATVSRSTYRRLFRTIGTAFGAGDGSTTFTLPDARNRVLVGAGSTYGVGATGGAATVTLTEAQMPSHTHGAVGDHTHATYSGGGLVALGSDAATVQTLTSSSTGYSDGVTSSSGGHTHTSVGGGAAHENMPPYLAVSALIKT